MNGQRTRNKRTKDNAKRATETALNIFTAACLLFSCFYKEWKKTRQRNIKSLISIAGVMEKKKNDTNISEVAGASAGLAGGILTIAGLITMSLPRKYKIQNKMYKIIADKISVMYKKVCSRLISYKNAFPGGCVPPSRNCTGGFSLTEIPLGQRPPPGQRPPTWTVIPLDRDPPRQRSPGQRDSL